MAMPLPLFKATDAQNAWKKISCFDGCTVATIGFPVLCFAREKVPSVLYCSFLLEIAENEVHKSAYTSRSSWIF